MFIEHSQFTTSWGSPKGGYFISLDTMEGCAQKVVKLAAETGVVLTNAGATYPYGKDPLDRNILIVPPLSRPWTNSKRR